MMNTIGLNNDDTPFFHVIKDPIHGTMQFNTTEDQWIKPFIDSTSFQRLRHIKQMGICDFIFPGAVHTRFNHSLGCCYVGGQIAQKIGLTDLDRQLVMIACLLHDIGHGPLSHTFESLFSDKLIHHEDWTPYFLADYRKDKFFANYNQLNPQYPLQEDNFDIIAHMIMHEPVENRILADIVSSQLDADRLDYLLRDTHFCGVQYGQFDFRWMLHCLVMIETKVGKSLGVHYKGIGAVEHYLMARRLMIRNIYQLQKKLALEYFLISCLADLAGSLGKEPLYDSIQKTRFGEFLLAVNEFNKAVLAHPKSISHTKEAFLKKNYILYKELYDYDVFAIIKYLSELNEPYQAIQLAKRLQTRCMPKTIRLNYADLGKIEAELATFKEQYADHIEPWQLVIIQAPHQAYSKENDPIWVIDDHGRIQTISEYSFMLNAFSDRLEHSVFLCVDQFIAGDKHVDHFIEKMKNLT